MKRSVLVVAVGVCLSTWVLAQETRPPEAGAAAATLDPVQRIAAERAGEALEAAVRLGASYRPGMKAEEMALLIVRPGRWALLINHPRPPAPFKPAGSVERRKVVDDEGKETLPEPWSVAVAGPGAALPFHDFTRAGVPLGGRRTAVVEWNDTTAPLPSSPGGPPAEAVISRMARGLWEGFDESLRPEGHLDVQPWAYRVTPEEIALQAIEQRLLLRTARFSYNEETMGEYRGLLESWIAVRKARREMNPAAVAIEEQVELEDGIADFVETAPFRASQRGEWPALEAADPFFDRYRNFLTIRTVIMHYPAGWHPSNPVEALQHARTIGSGLAYAAWPVARSWHEELLSPRTPERRRWTEILGQALHQEAAPTAESGRERLEKAKGEEDYPRILEVVRDAMAAPPGAGCASGACEGGRRLTLDLSTRSLTAWEAKLERARWAGGKVEVRGPLLAEWKGGSLRLGREARLLAAADPATGRLASLSISIPSGAAAELSGRSIPLDLFGKGRQGRGSGSVSWAGVSLVVQDGRLEVSEPGARLTWPSP